MKVIVIFVVVLIASAIAAPSVLDNKVDSDGNFSRMAKILGNCAESEDMTTCLAVKGITALNRAARTNYLEILPGVTFTRDPSKSVNNERSLSETELLSELPANSEEKSAQLIDMAMTSAANLVTSHNLEIKVPAEATQEVARAIEEGRGKMKKLMGPLMMAVGAKIVALIPILLGGLALLATKALVVAKIAFILALVLGASKLFGGGSSVLGKIAGQGLGGSTGGWATGGAQGWSSGGAGGYPYARSLDAQHLAYNAQIPTSE